MHKWTSQFYKSKKYLHSDYSAELPGRCVSIDRITVTLTVTLRISNVSNCLFLSTGLLNVYLTTCWPRLGTRYPFTLSLTPAGTPLPLPYHLLVPLSTRYPLTFTRRFLVQIPMSAVYLWHPGPRRPGSSLLSVTQHGTSKYVWPPSPFGGTAFAGSVNSPWFQALSSSS